MKKLLFAILALLSVYAGTAQTRVTAPVVTNSPLDTTYPTHLDTLGHGGLMSFTNQAYRDLLPMANRKRGMFAVVQDTLVYVLVGGIGNENWVRMNFGLSPELANIIDSITPNGDSTQYIAWKGATTLFYFPTLLRQVSGIYPISVERVSRDSFHIVCATCDNFANGLISGGKVSYAGTGYSYNVTSAVAVINQAQVTSAAGTVTLGAADATFDRLDIIALDNTGALVVVAGVPSANPLLPQVDPATQLALTTVTVKHGTTAPPDVTVAPIYNEHVSPEWTPSASTGFTTNFDNTSAGTVFSGTKSADIGVSAITKNVVFTGTLPVNKGIYTILNFHLKLKAPVPSAANISIALGNGNVNGAATTLAAAQGFSKTSSAYQDITILLNNMAFPAGEAFNKIVFTLTGAGNPGFYLDKVELQGGIPNISTGGISGLYRKLGKDSIYWIGNDGFEHAIRDSLGSGGGGGGVQSVTGGQVNNTDPLNPIINQTRFGATGEDVSATGDRYFDLGGHNFAIQSTGHLTLHSFDLSLGGVVSQFQLIGNNVGISQQDNAFTSFQKFAQASDVQGTYTIPLTVNGIPAGPDGNIALGGGGGGVPPLQDVTDVGAYTTNDFGIRQYITDLGININVAVLKTGGDGAGYLQVQNYFNPDVDQSTIYGLNYIKTIFGGTKKILFPFTQVADHYLPLSVDGHFAGDDGNIVTGGGGGGGSSSLQQAFDQSVLLGDNPTINAHGNDLIIDSVGTFVVNSYGEGGWNNLIGLNDHSAALEVENGIYSGVINTGSHGDSIRTLIGVAYDNGAGFIDQHYITINHNKIVMEGNFHTDGDYQKTHVFIGTPDTVATPDYIWAARETIDGQELVLTPYPGGGGGGGGTQGLQDVTTVSAITTDVIQTAGYNVYSDPTTNVATLGSGLDFGSIGGVLTLKSTNSNVAVIRAGLALPGNVALRLPSSSGTLALLSDITGGGANFIFNEPFTGSTSSILTLANPYLTGKLLVSKNGNVLDPTTDYTETTSTTITLNVPRLTGDKLLITYQY